MDEATKKPKLSFSGVQPINPTANPASLTGYLSMSMQVAQKNAVEAELAPAPSMDKLNFDQQQALTRGYLKHFVNKLDKSNPDTATILKGVDGALRSQDFNALGQFFPELVPSLSIYQNNPKALGNYVDFAKEYLGGQIKVVESVSTLVQAEADAAAALDVRNFKAGTMDAETSVYNNATSVQAVGTYSQNIRSEIEFLRSEAVDETNEDMRTALTERADKIETQLASGLVARIIKGKTPEDADRIRQAVADNDKSNLSADELIIFSNLMHGASPNIRNHIDSQLGEYAAGPAKFAEAEQKRLASEQAADLRGEFSGSRFLRDLDGVRAFDAQVEDQTNSINGLGDGEKKALIDDGKIAAARSALSFAIKSAASADELTQMQLYFEFGEAGNLSRQVLDSIDLFVELGGKVSDNGFRGSEFNRAEQLQRDALLKARDARALMDATNNVAAGRGNPTTQEGRTAADNWTVGLVNRYRSDVGGVPLTAPPADLWTNPTYMQDPQYSKVFSMVYKTPSAMPSGLLNSFQSLAAGVYNPTTMAHYNAMKSVSTPQGIIPNPALNALDENERGRLEFYSQVLQLAPEANIATLTAAANQNMSKEGFSKTVGMFLGSGEEKPINDWMLESITDYQLLNTAQQESVKSLVTYLVADTLAGSPTQQTPKSIARRINDQMNSWFPDSEGYVIDMSNGLPSSRTKLSLSQTIPKYQAEFIQYVQDEVRKNAPDAQATKFMKSPSTGFFGALESTSQAIAYGYGAAVKPFIQLVPRGTDRFGGQTYMVTSFNPESGMRNPVVKQNGEPLMVSTAEPGFASITNKIATEERLLAERQEAAAKDLLDLTSGRTQITLGGN